MGERWIEQNDRFLSEVIAWLQAMLEYQVAVNESAGGDRPTTELFSVQSDNEFVPALAFLAQRFDLSVFEQQLLLLCAAVELNTQIAPLCAKAQDNPQRPYPTFALALTLFDQPDWSVVMTDGTLRDWQLIDVTLNATTPLTVSPLRADMRVVNYLKGVNKLDSRLFELVSPLQSWLPAAPAALPTSQQATMTKIIDTLTQSEQHPGPYPVLQLLGPDSTSQEQIAQAVADQLGRQIYRLSVEQLPVQSSELTALARLWHRETLLLPVALYLEGSDIDAKGTQATALKHFVSRCQGICFINMPDKGLSLGRAVVAVEVSKPTSIEQRSLWQLLLGPDSEPIPTHLASQFCLNAPDIVDIASTVLPSDEKPSPHSLNEARIWNACLDKTRPKLDNLAQRLTVKATWDDIVLPAEETALLHQIAEQVRQRALVYDDWGFRQKMNRGLGVSVLFAGESGTGKTMAAEVIAHELRLHLYRIDLSAVVSKYIGETEKNLRKLFDAAEDGGTILFFDEADALFGKRSDVKDSHDRYANIETNYLLQRLEAYQGLAILATNLRSSLDTAFLRRLRFVVTFPVPARAERLRLWQQVFPAQTPVADLDYRRLARLNFTGGNIHAIAINSAFLAAKEKSAVGMRHVLTAARAEYRKLERPINEEDFRE